MRWAIALLLLAPLAAAGTAEDPEFTDPADDRELSDAGFNGLEIVQGWVQHTDTDLVFFLEMANDASPGSSTQYEWWFEAKVGDTAVSAGVIGLNEGGYEVQGDASNVEVQGSLIKWTVPRADVGADDGVLVSEIYAHADGYAAHGGPPQLATDRGPNEGFGRDYLIVTPVEAPMIEYQNVTEGELLIASDFSEAFDGTTVYNWTGPANATFDLNITGAGNVTVEVMDPAGGEAFSCVCSDGTNESMVFRSDAGNWSVTVAYDGFTGALSLRMAGAPDDGGHDDHGDGMDGDGMDGADGNATGGEDSPLPLAVLLIALLIAVRRR